MTVPRTLTVLALASFAFACSTSKTASPNPIHAEASASDLAFTHIESPTIHRLLKLSDRIYTGAEPKLEESFAALSELGVKTLIGVDSARPKIEWAGKYGMRYVHIPIGYDGIEMEQAAAFASVVKNCEGPFYFHCHHGRHRGPAAAAIGLMADSDCGGEGGLAVLEAAGTSENYPGLWRDVRVYQDPSQLQLLDELPEVAAVNDFNSGMAVLDRQWDETKLIKKASWLSSAEHPDLDPHHTALILSQTFDDLATMVPDKYASETLFIEQMQISRKASSELEVALTNADAKAAGEAYDRIRKSCKACHFEYRDN